MNALSSPAVGPSQMATNAETGGRDESPPGYEVHATTPNLRDKTQSNLAGNDPRSSSQESILPPSIASHDDRRTLLVIYIHGFMGDTTSFQSFPAHVHQSLSMLLADTHVVHTKLYPRYRSRRNISFARDDFSKWLAPHEGPHIDVVLLGHSMGGLVSAEIATLIRSDRMDGTLKHRILGTINFDVPFLGMHPGIIMSGLSSLFRSADPPSTLNQGLTDNATNVGGSISSESLAGSTSASTSSSQEQHKDPHFNPSFANDVILPVRTGWRNAWHFVNKHSGDLRTATKNLISSHMEFGGAMANYPELRARYARVRVLEEADVTMRTSLFPSCRDPCRVRFVNYYTVCTGYPKRKKSKSPDRRPSIEHGAVDMKQRRSSDEKSDHSRPSSSIPAGVKVEAGTTELTHQEKEEIRLAQERERMAAEGSRLRGEKEKEPVRQADDSDGKSSFDRERIPRLSVSSASRSASITSTQDDTRPGDAPSVASSSPGKPLRERHFCNLPPADSHGTRDPCWVRVFMNDVDEVGAHCGLFFVQKHYEQFVGEVASRIEDWIREDTDLRVIREMQALQS